MQFTLFYGDGARSVPGLAGPDRFLILSKVDSRAICEGVCDWA